MEQWIIDTQLSVHFLIKNSVGLFEKENKDILEFGSNGKNSRRFIVIDRHICQWYLTKVIQYFKAQNVEIHVLAIDASESDKNLNSLLTILHELEKFAILRRNEPLIAIGGGVLLDIAGLAASIYRRGIPYIRVPTTLVGIVDASIGAKTGINFESRRNRLGSYYPPIASYLDRTFLKTLSDIDISSGLGEILKIGIIKDRRLFELLEKSGYELLTSKFDCVDAEEVINRAITGMKVELENNLWEIDLKRVADFGHSFSPIIEMRSIDEKSQFPLTHGQAVTLDMLFSCVISHMRGMLSKEELLRVIKVAKLLSLPIEHELFNNSHIIFEALNDTITHRNGNQNLPIPTSIGNSIFINDVTYDEICQTISKFEQIKSELK